MSKHAPGPWYVVTKAANPYWRCDGTEVSSEYGRIADCGSDGMRALDVCQANARLIAAASELLDALTMVRDYVVTMKGRGHEYQVAIDAAIAKATGEQA
ncbi:hypothetical protein [Frateuria terrea]|uniref:Uncharacterized protein n=1 Tax=Frateuria terrea TaxID=529704 RepID=A0A1H6ZZG1_9GAMM|nr:hypothetical protein [Frateuria terrea]SEJ54970.1 hypothetical protein SAMN04487997_0178 [Frateuria terrea]SFP47518.1 hypothetical protein SAMN02927913_2212 [Frateuria terrea]